MFIARGGQEGTDVKFDAYANGTPHYLALTEAEKGMIAEAKRLCKNVIQTGLCRTAAYKLPGCTALFMVCMVLRLRAERFLLDSGSPIWYNVPDKRRSENPEGHQRTAVSDPPQ